MITWKGNLAVAKPEPQATPLTPEQEKRLEMGQALYLASCMACHQLHGMGQAGMAPSLVDSPWVLGSSDRLIRISLNGLQGPITIDDQEWNLVMPPLKDHPLLDDEGLAAVLTYVRRAWEHTGDPIEPAQVKKIREAEADRIEMWTVEELLKIK